MKRADSGQTIIEVTVALAILSIVGGVLVAIGLASVRTATNAKLRAMATDLAEEAIELARYTRDQGTTASIQSLMTIANGSGKACVNANLQLYDCNDNQCFGSDLGSVSCTGQSVVFTRSIQIDPDVDKVLVTVTVTWGQGDSNQTVEFKTYLSKWYAG